MIIYKVPPKPNCSVIPGNPSSSVPPYTAAEGSRTAPFVSPRTNGLFLLGINGSTVTSATEADTNVPTQRLVPKGNLSWKFWG